MPFDHTRGRIAIVYPWSNLETVPSLRNAAVRLAEHGYKVEFYTLSDDCFPAPVFRKPAISVITDRPEVFTKAGIVLPKWWTCGRGGRPYSWLVSNLYRPLWRRLSFERILRQRHATQPYTCFIGVDPEGLVDAAPLAELLDVPLVYWSLELLFADEADTPARKALKRREIAYSRQVAFIIIQDELRAQALSEENGLDSDRFILVPNSPLGPARRRRSNYLHRRWQIPSERRIALCAGTITWWAMSKELVSSVATWPEEYVLVLHSRLKMYGASHMPYIDSVVQAAGRRENVILSSEPLPSDRFLDLVDSADVGIALYSSQPPQSTRIDKNMQIIGLSSGKAATYLHHGLPVVVSDSPGLGSLVESYKCGVSVSDPAETSDALREIEGNYEFYSANAIKCFNERLEFGRHFQAVIERIEQLR